MADEWRRAVVAPPPPAVVNTFALAVALNAAAGASPTASRSVECPCCLRELSRSQEMYL